MTNHAHILLRSGLHGLSQFMRLLLTGYAVTYNRRHRSHGHLFQNRYKSIVCEEDTYFQELVGYIHLNPLRVGLVESFSQLDRYPWSDHSAVTGKINRKWQDVDYVLSWFGQGESLARRAYAEYVKDGIPEGRRPELVGGGLIRSLGGWSQVLSMRRHSKKSLADDRILGSSDFVERMLKEADDQLKVQFSIKDIEGEAERLMQEICER